MRSGPADSSLMAVMGETRRKPMKPRHDEPQVNVQRSRSTTRKKHKKPTRSIDEMDEASKEAHIVHKIEMAIKKSRSERRASLRSRSRNGRRDSDPHTPAQHRRQSSYESEEVDENYEMIKTPGDHLHSSRGRSRSRSRPKRSTSHNSSSKLGRHMPKPQLEAPKPHSNKYKKTKSLIDLDDRMDALSQMDGLVDDKRGFRIDVDENWITNTFSDPTLDTYENNHFLGQDKKALVMLDPQRIQCGPARSTANSSSSGKEPDPVTSIIDRINERKETPNNRRKAERQNDFDNVPLVGTHGRSTKQQMPKELISFDNYEDDDGYYYEDDEDEYPIYPSSMPPPPPPRQAHNSQTPVNRKFQSLVPPYEAGEKTESGSKLGGLGGNLDANMLQSQLDEINQLHRDIQRQQEMIKHVSQLSSRDAHTKKFHPSPHESSAEIYQRELARQAQAELYRLELVQKSMMLEKQMEVYRKNMEEWNKIRDMAIEEEESRRKIVEKAKEVWQAEMRAQIGDEAAKKSDSKSGKSGNSNSTGVSGNSGLYAIQERDQESQNDSSLASHFTHPDDEPSLYQKVAALNNQVELSEEDQKLIEAEILKELHVELSKQAAQKKIMQKPKFFSEKLRSSWSGKPSCSSTDSEKPVEQITEELTRQIRELNMEMAQNKHSKRGKSRKSKDDEDGSIKKKKSLFKVGKSKTKDSMLPPTYEEEESRDDADEGTIGDNASRSLREAPPKKKKTLLRALGLRKNKDHSKDAASKAESGDDRPQPLARTFSEMVSPKANKKCDFDDDESDDESSDVESEEKVSSSESQSESAEKPSTVPSATSSQTTQLTSNRVFIGVDGDAIETMSVSSRNAMARKEAIVPAFSKDSSCDSRDRYTTESGEDIVTSGKKKVIVPLPTVTEDMTPRTKKEQEPSFLEFLEVQYYPHDEQVEAPLDEMEADASKYQSEF